MVRNIDQQADYSNYLTASRVRTTLHRQYRAGYHFGRPPTSCDLRGADRWLGDQVENTHQSHEIRVSTPDDWRLRGLVGAFWEKFEIDDQMNFNYLPHALVLAGEPRDCECWRPGLHSIGGPVPGFPGQQS